MRLFFDTETCDYWNFKSSPTDDSQPMIVQVAAVLEDEAGRTVAALSAILQQHVWPAAGGGDQRRPRARVTARCTAVHGIDDAMVDEFGQPPDLVFEQLRRMVAASQEQIAFNINFDLGVLRNTTRVLGVPPIHISAPHCAMRACTDIVRATRADGSVKWPKLAEAYEFFQKRPMSGAHDALVDVYGCRAVYRGTKRFEALP